MPYLDHGLIAYDFRDPDDVEELRNELATTPPCRCRPGSPDSCEICEDGWQEEEEAK